MSFSVHNFTSARSSFIHWPSRGKGEPPAQCEISRPAFKLPLMLSRKANAKGSEVQSSHGAMAHGSWLYH